MTPQSHAIQRSPRVRFPRMTPAVVRSQDGSRRQGELEMVSLTGGLLCLPKPLDRGSRVKLMFMTHTGAILTSAEMLKPVSRDLQPFRFVAFDGGDQRKLRAAIQWYLGQNSVGEEWIDKYRAKLAHRNPPRGRLFTLVLFAAVCLGGICIYSGRHRANRHRSAPNRA
jgi:hypothetical protein